MFDVHTGMGYDVTLTYTKADGSPGGIEDGSMAVELSDPALATAVISSPFDPATGIAVVKIDHNGSIGSVDFSVRADGDLGSGVHPIVWSDTFVMLAPLGATGVAASVSAERPTTP